MALLYLLRPYRIIAYLRPAATTCRFYSNKQQPKPQQSEYDSKKSTAASKSSSELHRMDTKNSTNLSQQENNPNNTNVAETERKVDTVKTNIFKFVFDRVSNFTRKFENKLEKRFPKAIKISRLSITGTISFVKDVKGYTNLLKATHLHGKDESELTRKELELIYKMPRDIRKFLPLSLIIAAPFAQYAILPIVYKWPRYWLTRHFWTPEQQIEFGTLDIKSRISHNRDIFRALQAKLPQVESREYYNDWNNILAKLGSGQHPTVDEIIAVKELFTEAPYTHRSLSRSHITNLCVLHDIGFFFRKFKLGYRASIVLAMDAAILKEGGVQKLTIDELREACFLRGLNAADISTDDLKHWLEQWLQITKVIVKSEYISLYLHLPILLTYNHPNNWKLIYSERQ